MRAGTLDRRVTLQTSTPTRDAHGQAIESWSDVADVAAKVETISGSEVFSPDTEHALLRHEVTIRYRDDVTPRMRVLYSGRALDIEAVIEPPRPRRSELRLVCREVVD